MAKGFQIRWRKVAKIAAIVLISVLTLFGVTTWVLFQQRNELLLAQVQHYLDQSQSGQLSLRAMDLRLFRSFPDLSIELDSVNYFEHRDSLREPGEAPIFHAVKVYVALSLWPLLSGDIEIAEVTVSDGQVNFIEYGPGDLNVNRAIRKPRPPRQTHSVKPAAKPQTKQTPRKAAPKAPTSPQKVPPPGNSMKVSLEKFAVAHLRITWQPHGLADNSSFVVESLEVELDPGDSLMDFAISSNIGLDTVYVGRTRLPEGKLQFRANGQLETAKQHLSVQHATLTYNDFSVTVSGTYEHVNHGRLNVEVDASTNDLPLLEKLLRPDAIQDNRDLLRGGDVYVKGRLYGDLRNAPPQFDFTFGVKDLSFRLPGKYGSFRNLGFAGRASSGTSPDYSGATLRLTQLQGQVPGGFIKGDFTVTNFVKPWLTCDLNAQFSLDGYDKAFRISRVEGLTGSVSAKIGFNGPLNMPWPGSKGPKAKFDASFRVSKLSFTIPGKKEGFRDIGLTGIFTSGSNPDQSQAVLDVPELHAQLPGGTLNGKLRLTNLVAPELHYRIGAAIDLEGLDELLGLTAIRNLRGKAKASIQFDGPLDLLGSHAMDSSRASTVRLDTVSFQLTKNRRRVTNLQASLSNQNNLADIHLALRYGDSDLKLSAKVENLMHRIFKNERVMHVIGKIESDHLYTRDLIMDSLRSPIIDDHASGLSLAFEANNLLPTENATVDELALQFMIRNLSTRFAKLPDIRDLDAQGIFRRNKQGIALVLKQFSLSLPEGSMAISGDMTIPAHRQLNANTKVELKNFPWVYVDELIDEIKDGVEPSRKNMPAREMDRINGSLDASAMMRTFPFDFQKLEMRNSRILYTMPGGRNFGVTNLNIALEPFFFQHPANSGAITGLRKLQGKAAARGLKIPGLIDLNVNFDVQGKQDTLGIGFISNSRKARNEEGAITVNLSSAERKVDFHYSVDTTPVDALIQRISKKDFLKGDVSYTVDLHTSGNHWGDVQRNLAGTIAIQSDSLELFGIDIDDALTKYEKSQKFNLADLGAIVLVGPVGIVATKGSDFVALATIDVNNRERTHIQQLLAQWKLEDRVLQTTDVAFATQKNRIAFNGAIDFARDSIAGVQIAVVDKNGCSLMDQPIYGKFSAVKTGKLNITKTLFGSVINFVDAIAGKDCKPVYTGRVKQPVHP